MEGQLVVAVYNFKGSNNDELCLRKGDVITVTQRDEGGWWEGTLGDTTGWFPSDYVKEYKERRDCKETLDNAHAFRSQVVDDVVESERAHVAELRNLLHKYLLPLEAGALLAEHEYAQLTANIAHVLEAHEALLEELEALESAGGRVGGVFLKGAPRLEAVHASYCSTHPRAVCVLDKYKDELGAFMEAEGAACPGLLVLTAGLSKPFRRLDKYPAMLQELARHAHDSHPDRGDTHRALAVYKDIAAKCSAIRRQKELELQVVTGAVRGWQGAGGSKDLASLGEVLHMGSVALGDSHADRYFVLFPATLLILSVSRRMSAFVYEGCLPLAGITVTKLEDTEKRKNAFEVGGSLIDTIVAVCQSNEEADKWVSLLLQHSNSTKGAQISCSVPHSPSKMSPTEVGNSQAMFQGGTNHKRSHSFNNHHSYTQFLQQQQKQKDFQNEKNTWIQASCDALLTQNPASSSRVTSSFSSNVDNHDRYSINSSYEGWSIKNMRPAPPLRPMHNSVSEEATTAAHPYAATQRKLNSYEEDALILRVIEAYCTSARSRNNVNSVPNIPLEIMEMTRRQPTKSRMDLGRLSCGKVQTHTHRQSNKYHPGNCEHVSEFDVCNNVKPLNNHKVRRNNSAITVVTARKVPDNKKLLTQRKLNNVNRSNPDLARYDSNSPLRRSAPLLDVGPARRASSPLLGGSNSRVGRGAVLLPARAPSLPLASAWCCGSFVKQLHKSHHFD